MKMIIGILLSLFLMGCSRKIENNVSVKDLSNKLNVKEDMQKNATEKNEEGQEEISNGNQEDVIQERYFYLEACEEMVDLEIDILEESYKQGKTSKNDYRSQKQELEQEEEQYKLEREALDYQENLYEPVHTQDSDNKAMKKRLIEVEKEEEDLERQMKKTEQDYMEHKLSQEDFILKRSKQEEEKGRLEQEEEWLKRSLEEENKE